MSTHKSFRESSLARRIGQVGLPGLMLLTEAFASLWLARIALRLVSSRRIFAWQQRPVRPGDRGCDQVEPVRWAVLTAARYAPGTFVCFPQCLAASAMLGRRGVASRLYYGARRVDQAGPLSTHTWLEACEKNVIGGEVAAGFATLAVYVSGTP